MKNPETCKINYCGYSKPSSPNEISFEILGLESLIKMAEQRISILKQSLFLAEAVISSTPDGEEAVLDDI